jgi:ABC-type sugar transport system permease subunit
MKRLKEYLEKQSGYLMLLPALLCIGFVHLYPSIDAIRMSFFDIQLLKQGRPFVYFQNFSNALKDPIFLQAFFNTIAWTVLSLVFATVFALYVSVKLNKSFRGRSFFRAIFLAPWITPPFIVAQIWKTIFNETFSPINSLLLSTHLTEAPISFLNSTKLFLGFFSTPLLWIIVVNVWTIFPFMMVMFLAGLQTMSKDVYEAGRIDGASNIQQFFRITLPQLLPVISSTLLIVGIWQFNNFNISYLLTHGGPLHQTELLAVKVYNEVFYNFKYSYGAAISVLMFLVILIPAVIYIRRETKANDA